MNVYTLFHGYYSDRSLVGVYTTLEAAQAAHADPDHVWAEEKGYPSVERSWQCHGRPLTDAEIVKWFGNRPPRDGRHECEYDIEERVLEGGAS